jgi:hypothetical protein
MALLRDRLLRGLELVQTSQPHPIAGTPTLVPDPNTMNSPGNEIVFRE